MDFLWQESWEDEETDKPAEVKTAQATVNKNTFSVLVFK